MITPNTPPVPDGWRKAVERTHLSVPLAVPYVIAQVVELGRGMLGYEGRDDTFVAYLKVEQEDREQHLVLDEVVEVWVAFRPSYWRT